MTSAVRIETIEGWRGQPIRGVRSKGSGVFHALDWRDLVIDASGEILRKRTTCRQSASFAPEARDALCRMDGFHTDLQSLQSEDTVTWAAFGPSAPPGIEGRILELAFGCATRPERWERLRWPTSWENPDGGGRPEPDVVLKQDGWCYVVEAKWRAPVVTQGKGGRSDQLLLRHYVAEAVCADPARRGVLVVVPGPARYAHARHGLFSSYFAIAGDSYRALPSADAIQARALTWEQVADVFDSQPSGIEVASYLRWRLKHFA